MDFNFTSQICTNKEQSERLLALGLKKETADCIITEKVDGTFDIFNINCGLLEVETIKGASKFFVSSPAWSLHRLIEMMPPGYREQIRVGTTDNPYEYMYQVIGRLVYVGEFNKKYLEE